MPLPRRSESNIPLPRVITGGGPLRLPGAAPSGVANPLHSILPGKAVVKRAEARMGKAQWREIRGSKKPHTLRNGKQVFKPARVIWVFGRWTRKGQWRTSVQVVPARIQKAWEKKQTPGRSWREPVAVPAFRIEVKRARIKAALNDRQMVFQSLETAKAAAMGLVLESLL